jgi:enamine deaminase RidA (YjgF/YER057c/UK114 family)
MQHVLSLTFFVAARDPDALREIRNIVLETVRDGVPDAPPVSVVAQPPEGERPAALEAAVLLEADPTTKVERRSHEGLGYTVVIGEGGRQVHAAGLASADGTTGRADQSREAFAAAQAILDAEGLEYRHIVRQWNYIEEMLDVRDTGGGDSQAYQAFNDVRSIAYGRSDFSAGYPAATGIGQKVGGICIELVAVDPGPGVRVEPVTNPRQIDAHSYSEDVLVGTTCENLPGTTSPKFERGKRVAAGDAEIVFVSGTASIIGEKSVAPGDVRAQTRTTIDNMKEVLGGRAMTHLRAYVKETADIEAVREECRAAFGDIPALYVEADVCRDELLVELEGESVIRRST